MRNLTMQRTCNEYRWRPAAAACQQAAQTRAGERQRTKKHKADNRSQRYDAIADDRVQHEGQHGQPDDKDPVRHARVADRYWCGHEPVTSTHHILCSTAY